MARLPIVGGDPENWGAVLNQYLETAHNTDGTLKLDVKTITDLKAIDVATLSNKQQALVAGYYAAGDGGGGQFYYDAGSNDADNGGTIIAPSAGAGRWNRISDDPVSVKWFGAKGDGESDDSVAIQAALNSSPAVAFPPGKYRVLTGLTLDAYEDIQVIGQGGVISPEPTAWPLQSQFRLLSMSGPANSVVVTGLIIDGTKAGWHDNERFSMNGIQLHAKSIVVRGCRISNFYGNGIIVRAGTPDISGNYLYKCGGYNLTADAGSRDNYGDGIQVYPYETGVTTVGGVISANYLETDPANHRCRGGIVLDRPAADATNKNWTVNVIGNTIKGYDRGIHVERAPYTVVSGNYVDGAHATVLVSTSEGVRVVNNTLIADSATAADTNVTPNYKSGLTLYDRNCHGCVVDGNTLWGMTCDAARIGWSGNIRFTNNDVVGDVVFGSSGSNTFYTVTGNTFARRSDSSDMGRVFLNASALIKGTNILANRFTNVQLDTTWMDGIRIRDNYFDFSTRDEWAVGITYSFNAVIEDNVFLLGDAATSHLIEASACRGAYGRISGNIVRTAATVDLLKNNALHTHNYFEVTRPNFLLRSNGDSVQMTFASGWMNGDVGAMGRSVAASSGNVPGGHYARGSIVWNTSIAPGAVAAQICTTAGYSAPAWAGATAYRPGNYVTNDSGKVYICTTSGTSAGSGGPTGIGAAITDGTATWAYVAPTVAAVFKTLATASF